MSLEKHKVALWLDFLDICVNQVLYNRGVYPQVAFRLSSCYSNLPVYQIQDPEVKAFIRDGLSSLNSLISEESSIRVSKLKVTLLSGCGKSVESFNFCVPTAWPEVRRLQSDFRGAMLQFSSRMSDLPALEPDPDMSFTFQVLTETKQDKELKTLDWFEINDPWNTPGTSPKATVVIPVVKPGANLLGIDIEICNDNE